jgi:4-amino-4-deoxy-L-arabinose transferase-like glycosyltransferase
MRPSPLALVLVLSVAAVLRFWHLGHGVPYAVGEDDPGILSHVLAMMRTGDFNPHAFGTPSLYVYLQLLVASARFLAGAWAGAWTDLSQVAPVDFQLWARALTALFGVATVLLVYQIGARWGARHALLAAGLLAVMPNHVRDSHHVVTDVPMAFFTTLAFLLALRAYEKGTVGAFAWAGGATGLAAATSYYGGLIVIAPLLAAWLPPFGNRRRALCALTAVGGSMLAFLLAAPYTVLDLPSFLNGLGALGGSAGTGAVAASPAWLAYLAQLRAALWWPGIVLLFSGFALAIVRAFTGPGRTRFVMLVVCPLAAFWLIASRPVAVPGRLMPLMPFASLLVAIVIVSGVSLLRRFDIPRAPRTALIAALTVVAILPPLVSAIWYDRQIGRRSTYAAAYDWVREHVPKGARVMIEPAGMRLPAREYHVMQAPAFARQRADSTLAADVDYFVAADEAAAPAVEPARLPATAATGAALFARSTLLLTITPEKNRPGPALRIYRINR